MGSPVAGMSAPGPTDPSPSRRLPLAAAQREVLLDQRAHPTSTHLLVGGSGLVRGPLDEALMNRSLQAMAREQVALRLRQMDHQGQTLLPAAHEPPQLLVQDAHAAVNDPHAALQQLWADWTQEPLDLRAGVPWRVAMLRFSPSLHGLLIQAHHAVLDGFGTAQMMRRWAAHYCAAANGQAPPPEDGDAYLAHVEADQNPSDNPGHHPRHNPRHLSDAAYWRQQFPEPPPPLFPQTKLESELADGDMPLAVMAEHLLSRERLEAWAAGAHTHNQTAVATLLAAMALHFARLHGLDDVVIGVPALNRSGRAHRLALGMYVGVMPLRVSVKAEQTATELMAQVAHQLHGGLRHAHYPLSQLARDLNLLAQGRSSVFDLLLSFERQDYTLQFGEATLAEARQLFSGRARFPLSLTVCDFGPDRDLAFVAEGSEQRFDERALALLLRRIAHVADQLAHHLVHAPETPVAQIQLLDAAERDAVLEDPHRDLAHHAPALSFIERFSAQAALLPQAIALTWDGGSQTYATLAAAVNALARRLVAQGAGPNRRVALALPRGPLLVQAMLATARAGAAFLPLDVAAPEGRHRELLREADPVAIVCSSADLSYWSALHAGAVAGDAAGPEPQAVDAVPPAVRPEVAVPTVLRYRREGWHETLHTSAQAGASIPQPERGLVSTHQEVPPTSVRPEVAVPTVLRYRREGWHETLHTSTQSEAPLDTPFPAETHAAYLLFTSGSTGQPKGVVVSHGALARRLAWLARAWGIGPADRSLQGTQPTFDPALIELLLPLTQGASIALPAAGRLAPEAYAAFAAQHGCSFTALVPTTLSRLLDGVDALSPSERRRLRLRVACCGGEVLPPALAQRWAATTGAALWNVYGPTEACIFATAWPCRDDETAPALPIGMPVDDTRLYVLDDMRQPLPYGTEGHIWIGGPTLSDGYLHDAARTAASFQPDPFVQTPHARMYATGDRGWWDGQGQLQFAGRADRQLKLRGLRIEPAEVEAALLTLPGVHETHVQAVRDGERVLLQAWVAPANLNVAELQAALRERLPDALVPSRWTLLDALPLTTQGKVDEAALPQDTERAPAREPRTALETTLRDLLREVLREPTLGVDDDFFASGGDSLAALDWLAAIETRTGMRPSIGLLMAAPTVARLAAALVQHGKPGPIAVTPLHTVGHSPLAVPLSTAQGQPTLFLAASGHGDLLRFQALAQSLSPHVAVQMLQPPPDLKNPSLADLAQAYADHIEQHSAALAQTQTQTHTQTQPLLLAGFSVGGVTAVETARQLRARGLPVKSLVLIDSVFPRWMFRQAWLWRLGGWLSRHLYIQELSLNGRRLGAMFNDAGLISQVLALQHYRVLPLSGAVTLIRTSGLASWQRWLFGPWLKQLSPRLVVTDIQGMHGSIFEPALVGGLAKTLLVALQQPIPHHADPPAGPARA